MLLGYPSIHDNTYIPRFRHHIHHYNYLRSNNMLEDVSSMLKIPLHTTDKSINHDTNDLYNI